MCDNPVVRGFGMIDHDDALDPLAIRYIEWRVGHQTNRNPVALGHAVGFALDGAGVGVYENSGQMSSSLVRWMMDCEAQGYHMISEMMRK